MKKYGALLLALACAFTLFAFAEDEAMNAVDLQLLDGEGNEVTLFELMQGKPVVLNIWATWCPPCRAELPYFDEAFALYGEDVVFMMIDLADGQSETVEGAKAFVQNNGYSFPVYFDPEYATYEAGYLGEYIPMTWFIGTDGIISDYVVGGLQRQMLMDGIEKLLAGAAE